VKTEREKTSLTTQNFSARGGRCQFLRRFVLIAQPGAVWGEPRHEAALSKLGSLTLPAPYPIVDAILPIDILYEETYSPLAYVQNVYRRGSMKEKKTDLLQGTLDMLVLKALALGPMHGLGVSNRIAQITQEVFQVKPGSLFPALHRMEEAGWLTSSWGESENNRRAKYYRLTKAGQRQLKTETEDWQRISLAIASALQAS
jgi:transcriptional regulator